MASSLPSLCFRWGRTTSWSCFKMVFWHHLVKLPSCCYPTALCWSGGAVIFDFSLGINGLICIILMGSKVEKQKVMSNRDHLVPGTDWKAPHERGTFHPFEINKFLIVTKLLLTLSPMRNSVRSTTRGSSAKDFIQPPHDAVLQFLQQKSSSWLHRVQKPFGSFLWWSK